MVGRDHARSRHLRRRLVDPVDHDNHRETGDGLRVETIEGSPQDLGPISSRDHDREIGGPHACQRTVGSTVTRASRGPRGCSPRTGR